MKCSDAADLVRALPQLYTGAHVHRFDREPRHIDPDHLSTSRRHIAHSCTAEPGHCTLTVSAPRRTSTVIEAPSVAFVPKGTGTKRSFDPRAGAGNAFSAVGAVPATRLDHPTPQNIGID
jgi:hypothetical protein